MSFLRLIYYCAFVGGWAAFAGWFLGEVVLMQRNDQPGFWPVVVTAALCGALIGGGLNFLAGIVSGPLPLALPRLAVGVAVGFVAGANGGLLGNLIVLLVKSGVGLVFGWTIMGTFIGVVEGIYDFNFRKIRNGIIGGTVGGFLGGLFFVLFTLVLSPMSGRAVGLVILGMCIGVSIGLAQVMLRDAWLTVEDGFRPGRQLLLSQRETFLGTSEKANLIFIAYGAKGVEPLHLAIVRLHDGTYEVRDNGSRTGTFINDSQVNGSYPLRNGDVIRFGINKVRFNERYRAAGARAAPPPAMPASWQPAAAPVVPVASAIRAALPAAPQAEVVQAVRAAPSTAEMPKPTAAPPAVRPPAAPVAAPAVPVQPAAPPARPQPAANECPICGTPAKGARGTRRCENCGGVF
jgi:hypothetical protein